MNPLPAGTFQSSGDERSRRRQAMSDSECESGRVGARERGRGEADCFDTKIGLTSQGIACADKMNFSEFLLLTLVTGIGWQQN